MYIVRNLSARELIGQRMAVGYHSCVVIGTYNGHLYKGQLELVRQAAGKNQKVLVIALRNPYDLRELPKTVYSVAVYEYTQKSLEAIAQLLDHQFIPKGILPVSM